MLIVGACPGIYGKGSREWSRRAIAFVLMLIGSFGLIASYSTRDGQRPSN